MSCVNHNEKEKHQRDRIHQNPLVDCAVICRGKPCGHDNAAQVGIHGGPYHPAEEDDESVLPSVSCLSRQQKQLERH